MDFLNIFISVVFPVFLMAAVGALVHRFRPISPEPLSQAILFIFSPALVFNGLATTQVALEDLARIAVFSLLLLSSLYIIASLVARAMRVPKDAQTTFVIAALFMNAGNYGLPVALFAFGDEGLAIAVVFFVTQAILAWTVGAFIASRAQSNLVGSLISVAKLPTSYAAVGGLAVSMLAIDLPDYIQQPAQIMGDAAIPAMLIVLGIQLASTREMAGGAGHRGRRCDSVGAFFPRGVWTRSTAAIRRSDGKGAHCRCRNADGGADHHPGDPVQGQAGACERDRGGRDAWQPRLCDGCAFVGGSGLTQVL